MEYFNCEEGCSQYDDYDLYKQNIVDAIYIHAKLDIDKGNPYIEALPMPRSDNEIMIAYNKSLPGYRFSDIKSMSRLDKMLSVGTLRDLRFPLPFHRDLEFAFYNALISSYRSRKQIDSDNTSLELTINNESETTNTILCGDSSASTNAGFSLIGFSGSGKSSGIHTLVHHYPQTIIHTDQCGNSFPQITYLVVNCIPNSNFSALYEGIGDAIDKALNNISPIYAKAIRSTNGLGKKAELIREFIEKFAIGIIIFDEIQFIDFVHTKENTFNSLLTLANKTKVAIAVVGTEDAKECMFKELRTSRRIGVQINGNQYCNNKKFFSFLVKSLFNYQWFDEPIEATEEITDTLFDVTKGIIDQLISVYSCMHYDYLTKTKPPVINDEYIRKVANKFYPGIQNVLANFETPDNSELLQNIRNKAEDKINAILDTARQEQEMQKIINTDTSDELIMLSNISSNIRKIYDEFSDSQIEDAYKKVICKNSNKDESEKILTRLVIEQLQKVPKRTIKKNKIMSPDMQHMKDFLEIRETK